MNRQQRRAADAERRKNPQKYMSAEDVKHLAATLTIETSLKEWSQLLAIFNAHNDVPVVLSLRPHIEAMMQDALNSYGRDPH